MYPNGGGAVGGENFGKVASLVNGKTGNLPSIIFCFLSIKSLI